MNPVVIAVGLMLVLSLLRINVVVSLALGAIAGGLVGGLSLTDTLTTFSGGLGGRSAGPCRYQPDHPD